MKQRSLVRQKRARFSPQRDCIYKIVTSQSGHLSVDKIFEQARKIYAQISLATVYRNLQQLEATGAISSVQGKDQKMYYERFAAPHHHFICENCSTIINVDNPSLPTCMSCIHQAVDWKIKSIITTLYGLCPNCQKEKGKLPVI